MFRRAQAILVLLALLAAPLALYARGAADAMPDCNGMCCLPHHHHAPQPAPATPEKDADCHHAAAAPASEAAHSCAFDCAMRGNRHQMNYGLLAPIAPTRPSDLTSIRIAVDITRAVAAPIELALPGFYASPFQPPRA